MPLPGETLVQPLSHMPHANTNLRHLYKRVESGALPSLPSTKVTLSRTVEEKVARYPHGKRVGPYLLGKTIGEGSFAKVKEALHSAVGEKVAIKVIDKKVVREDPYLRKNMRREAGLLQSLRRHPNIVSLFEVMETDNNFYMVLELCTGGALLDRICSEKCLSEGEAKHYVRQIVSAVDHIHQAGILHRDLKVENLLLDANNNIKIIDFGLSNVVGKTASCSNNGRMRAEFRGTQCGSPAYAAPEIIANKRYGPKVDVWSIGVNTFAMLAGCLPFTVEPFNIKLLLKKINNRDMAEMPTHLSNDCKDFIRKLLHPDPRMRYSVSETMNHKWLAADKEPTTRPRTVSPSPGGRVSRMELENDILEYIWSHMGYNINHVTDSVISKRADEYSAIYYLLLRRRNRQHAKMLRKLESAVDEGEPEAKISAQNLYDEATAMELAGRKNGSLHFKMALLLEQEIEVGTATDHSSNDDRQITPTSITRNALDAPDELVKPETHAALSSDAEEEKAVLVKSDGQARVLPKESGNSVNLYTANHNFPRFHPSFNAQKVIQPKAAATGKIIMGEWQEVSKRVSQSISDNRAKPSAWTSKEYKLSTAHKVNLTFKQSDIPSENFADHFNYRRRETGNHMRLILAPTRATFHAPNKRIISIPTWRQSSSIDCENLKNRKDDWQISPRKENLEKEKNPRLDLEKPGACDIKPSSHATKDAIVQHRNTRNIKQPVPPEFKVLAKRQQLKVSKRKSIENPSLNLKRPTGAGKRKSNNAKFVARFPGRPKTPAVAESQTGQNEKVPGTTANKGGRESCDQMRDPQRSKSTVRKVTESSADKCEADTTVRGNSQLVPPPSQIMPEAAPPLMKKLSKKIQRPKASLTKRRLVCNEVSADTVV